MNRGADRSEADGMVAKLREAWARPRSVVISGMLTSARHHSRGSTR